MSDADAEHRYRLMWEMAHAASQERAEVAEAATVDFRATIDHLRDQLSRKDAEIEHLKLEMDGVDNAKEEIGRLLGLTEEFRWKRISAAIHEQKRLIRELMDGRHRDLDKMREMKALIRELVAALETIKTVLDEASDECVGELWVDDFTSLGAFVDAALAETKAAGFTSTPATTEPRVPDPGPSA